MRTRTYGGVGGGRGNPAPYPIFAQVRESGIDVERQISVGLRTRVAALHTAASPAPRRPRMHARIIHAPFLYEQTGIGIAIAIAPAHHHLAGIGIDIGTLDRSHSEGRKYPP